MDLFAKGNRITTNGLNIFLVLDSSETDVACKDLLNGDFSIFSKTEHSFEIANTEVILNAELKEILREVEISEKDSQHILTQMGIRFNKWIE